MTRRWWPWGRRRRTPPMPRVTITVAGPDGTRRALPVRYERRRRGRGWRAVVTLPAGDAVTLVSASVAPSGRLASRWAP